MKALAYLKVTMKSVMKQFHVVIFMFCVFPIILGLGMASMQKDSFIKENKTPFVEVVVKDEDNSELSKSFLRFLKGKDLDKLVVLLDKPTEKSIKLTIPQGYEEKIKNKEKLDLTIKCGDKTEGVLTKILKDIVEKYNYNVEEAVLIESNIENKTLREVEKQNLYEKVNKELMDINSFNSIDENILKAKRTLTNYEYYSVTLLSYNLVILLISMVQGGYMEQEQGVTNRVKAAPITAIENFNYGFIGNVMYALIVVILYVTVYKVLGLSFKGSIGILLLLLFVSSLFIVSIASFLSQIIKKKYFNVFSIFLITVQMILGGTFIPLKKLNSNEFIQNFSKFSPDIFITKAYNNYIIHNSLSSISYYVLVLLGITATIYVASLIVVKIKEGVQ